MALEKSVSYSGQNQVDTLTSKVRLEEGKGRLVIFDGTNNLGVFGFDANGEVAVKIAKPGFDADTATDAQLIFNSSQNVFKIVDTNTLTLPAMAAAAGSFTTASASATTSIATSTALAVMGFVTSGTSTGFTALPYMRTELDGIGRVGGVGYIIEIGSSVVGGFLQVNVNGTNYQNSIRGSFQIRYYVLQETAQ